MVLSIKPAYRGVAVGATAGALLVGGFALGTTRGMRHRPRRPAALQARARS